MSELEELLKSNPGGLIRMLRYDAEDFPVEWVNYYLLAEKIVDSLPAETSLIAQLYYIYDTTQSDLSKTFRVDQATISRKLRKVSEMIEMYLEEER